MPSWVPWYRPPSRGSLAYEDWKDDASCNGLDVKLFELPDFEEVEREEGWEVIAEGLKVCSGCPVRAACKSNSTELDRYWTTRGGQPPEGLFPDGKRPHYESPVAGRGRGFLPDQGPERELKKTCKRGHDDWRQRSGRERFCNTCANDAARRRWSKKKSA